jgi:hypothetical protein
MNKNKSMTIPTGSTVMNTIFPNTDIELGFKSGVYGFIFTEPDLQILTEDCKFIPCAQLDNILPIYVLGSLLSRN